MTAYARALTAALVTTLVMGAIVGVLLFTVGIPASAQTSEIAPGIVVTNTQPIRVVRLAGGDRFETSALGNDFFYNLDGAAWGTSFVVVGQRADGTAPDALTAVAPDDLKQLVGPNGLSRSTAALLCRIVNVDQVVVYGGREAVSDAAVQQVVDRLNKRGC